MKLCKLLTLTTILFLTTQSAFAKNDMIYYDCYGYHICDAYHCYEDGINKISVCKYLASMDQGDIEID